jgi:protein-S-isoprenylcysteine O-methyltransferase Ste14
VTTQAPPVTGGSVGRRRAVDPARLGMSLLFTLMATSNVAGVVTAIRTAHLSWAVGGQLTSGALNVAFCALVAKAYLARGPARATDTGALIRLIAAVTTFGPLVLATAEPRVTASARTLVGLGLSVAGLAVAVTAVRVLSTNISVVPQARGLAERGPYRFVRHPLYTGEILASAGMALLRGWTLAVLVTGALLILQGFRARREERLLTVELPGYADYARRTRRLLPGLW